MGSILLCVYSWRRAAGPSCLFFWRTMKTCEFFITCAKCDRLDNKHVVFGDCQTRFQRVARVLVVDLVLASGKPRALHKFVLRIRFLI
ncbi:hypothetical protein BS78_06G040700 [Paspalum vaginatum]|nr:hypothetical protein BS78_06G040700 [Paspalum vaginatum]